MTFFAAAASGNALVYSSDGGPCRPARAGPLAFVFVLYCICIAMHFCILLIAEHARAGPWAQKHQELMIQEMAMGGMMMSYFLSLSLDQYCSGIFRFAKIF